MRYVEYIYLAIAVGLIIFMVTSYEHFRTLNYVAIVLGILVASFMYSYRRAQRQTFERAEADEIRQMEEEIEDHDD